MNHTPFYTRTAMGINLQVSFKRTRQVFSRCAVDELIMLLGWSRYIFRYSLRPLLVVGYC